MPRGPRFHSELGLYHVMVRGNGKQIIFESDEDREYYLKKLYFCFKDEGVAILSWCLMDNHAHLLVQDEDNTLPTAMARVNGSYAQYFNKKYGHIGHVFQDRYRCLPINDERYLLEVVRYIHNNPEDAGLCKAEDYRWSSYHEFMEAPRLVDTNFILGLLGGRTNFRKLCQEKSSPKLRLSLEPNPSTEKLLDIAEDVLVPIVPRSISTLPRSERNRCLRKLHDAGFSLRQIERITGIGRGTIVYVTQQSEDGDDF